VLEDRHIELCVRNLEAFGMRVKLGANVRAARGGYAGTVAERLEDLHAMFRDREVAAIWCARGGSGCTALLPHIDYALARRSPKIVVGFSDITALHGAVGAMAQVVSFHGPTARGPLGASSRESMANAVVHRRNSAGAAPDGEVLLPGTARGRLAGGNLALLSSLVGTPYFPVLDDAILVLEDVNEPVYRIDRMLRHLRMCGALSRLAGLVFGAFTERGDEGDSLSLGQVLRETAEAAGVPCLCGVPLGHLDAQWTLPLGAVAELDATNRCLTIELSAHA
jgi:muramoyltetrapeptide carboxypeptidase